jgi:hypothetical protein
LEVGGEVKNFFFFDKGSSSVRAVFDKDSYNVGETAHVECFVDNTKCSKTIRCLKIKFRRLLKGKVSHCTEKCCDETIIKREFGGMHKGQSGVIHLDCPIQLPKDTERFIHSLPHECLSHPSPDLDVLKMLAVPTVDSALIQCFYFMEIHIYYKGGLTTDKLKALSLPILVCRPILGAPIPSMP